MNDAVKGLGVILGSALLAYVVLGSDLLGNPHGDIEEAVAAELRDPSSAEFRDIVAGTSAVCGDVNGKNVYGAYAGFKSFVYADGIVLFEPEQPIAGDVESQTAYYKAVAQFARTSRRCFE